MNTKRRYSYPFIFILALLLCIPSFASAQTFGANLATNGDFERLDATNFPEGWSTDSYWGAQSQVNFSLSDQAHGGGHALQIQTDVADDARWTQEIEVSPDTTYRISGWVYAQDVFPEDSGANISALEALEAPLFIGDTQGQWQYYEYYGKTGEDQETLTLCLRLGGYGRDTTGLARFDDVRVEQALDVPQGATIASLQRDTGADGAGQDAGGEQTQAQKIKQPQTYANTLLACALFILMLYFIIRRVLIKPDDPLTPKQSYHYDVAFILLMVGALVLRLFLSAKVEGFETDMACFKGWAQHMAENGPWGFYNTGMFADYPPGYMYILWPIGLLVNLLGVSANSGVYDIMIKFPAVLCDCLLAYFIYRLAHKHMGPRASLALSVLVLFNPATIFNSSMFGQIDSLLVLLMLLSVDQLIKRKTVPACLLFVAAVLIKPQALMMGPLLLFALIHDVRSQGKGAWKPWLKGIGLGLGAFILLILPFWGNQDALWIFDRYFGTIVSYPYNTINACNLFMLGGNWVNDSTQVLFLSYKVWGILFALLVLAAGALLYFKNPKKRNLPLVGAFLIIGWFVLGPNMHERYIFPAIFLLLAAYILLKDKRLLWLFGGFSATMLFNTAMVLSLGNLDAGSLAVILTSLVNVVLFLLLAWTCWDLLLKKRAQPFEQLPQAADADAKISARSMREPDGKHSRFKRKDAIVLFVLTAVYAVVALVNLGSTQVPQKGYRAQERQTIEVNFAQPAEVGAIRYYGSIADGEASVALLDAAGNTVDQATLDQKNEEMYRWIDLPLSGKATGARISVTQPEIWLNELVFLDAQSQPIPVASATTLYDQNAADNQPANLFDEAALMPQTSSYMYEMYFDEIYHARTAFEHINGMQVYETTHPPLGKVFIALGVEIFGMNPFGWRIVGTLFGVAMIPLMYMFGLRLFKRTRYAFITAFLFAFDFMHFVQTRIATIDVYGVFFIILMFYFMYRYMSTSFYNQPLKKTLVPLALCGLAFGLGAASKWICLYAGVGLAILFFYTLYRRYREFAYARDQLEKDPECADAAYFRHVVEVFKPYAIRTVLWCIPIFILLPLAIYFGSYLSWLLASEVSYTFKDVWNNQLYMLSYHSDLTATHPYSAQWWDWPLILRPIWYYSGGGLPQGQIASIAAFGNPAVWWAGFAATIWMILAYFRRTLKKNAGILMALVALCVNFLPWVFINRATFIYHYFASVPFIIFAIVYFIRHRERTLQGRMLAGVDTALNGQRLKRFKRGVVIYLALVLVLFAVFYPVLSGTPISIGYEQALRWFNAWVF